MRGLPDMAVLYS